MHIYKEKEALVESIKALKNEGASIGFVPTMGALHRGHLSLIQQALAATDKVVVSIFVNPTQFNNKKDLKQYPRNLENDVAQLFQLGEELIIFSPTPQEIYGENIHTEHFTFDGLEHVMEGKYRKGHFDGVGTVIKKLFEIVKPDKAFFGEKDYQQLQIIKKYVEQSQLNIEVIGCPIDRENSGLARSSRNERLSGEQRQNAAFIYQILLQVKEQFGTKNALEISNWVKEQFSRQPGLELEYFEIAHANSLKTMGEKINGENYRAFIAAFVGNIRLIDNIALN